LAKKLVFGAVKNLTEKLRKMGKAPAKRIALPARQR
jgi:hypothetical protein